MKTAERVSFYMRRLYQKVLHFDIKRREMALGIFLLQSEGIWEGVAEGANQPQPQAFGLWTPPPLKQTLVFGTPLP
jgi:hypothetical protein